MDDESDGESPFEDLADNVRACMATGAWPGDLDVQSVTIAIWAHVHGATALALTIDEPAGMTRIRDAMAAGLRALGRGFARA
ncbi:MAG: hypothetical protein AAF602_01105 [Myxococcota bacterium]